MVRLVNRVVMFVVLLLAQVLVLNHMWLLNVATPLLYVYFAITFPRNTEKGEVLVWCFILGLLIDIFSNTPGLAAGSLFILEAFNFFDWQLWLLRTVCSAALTLGLLLAIESLRSKK